MYTQKVKELVKEYFDSFNEIPLWSHFTYIFHIPQNISEIVQVANYLGDRKFKYFVELGSDNGGSLWLYANLFCTPDTKIISIDPTRRNALTHTVEKLRKKGFKNVEWISLHSHDAIIEPGLDFLHIDAGHHYHAVKGDYEKFKPMMVPGGVILMHDTYNHDGCIQFRKELELTPGLSQTFVDLEHTVGITMVEKKD